MDDRRFDALTRAIGRGVTRRQLLRAGLGLAAGGLLARVGRVRPTTARAAEQAIDDAFQRTWERTDRPVAEGRVARTWLWGPQPISPPLTEPYAESPGGQRLVQYFDKSRME